MLKLKKTMAVLLCILTLLSVCCVAAGCPQKEKEPEKYDVTIKMACYEVVDGKRVGIMLDQFIFTPDISEMHIEREYDGKQYDYAVIEYKLSNSNKWFEPNFWDSGWFHSSMIRVGQRYDEESPKWVCERGEYLIDSSTESALSWKHRSIKLYVTVI